VVSDIRMPGMDGFGLLREIRALGPDAGGSVPVIAMTAHITHADANIRQRAKSLSDGTAADAEAFGDILFGELLTGC
jgi:CheY-like chemotaxis protein